jgi:hypothetical protein
MKQEPKKLGRPRVHEYVMTNAQRQQRWRDKVKQQANSLLNSMQKNNEKTILPK